MPRPAGRAAPKRATPTKAEKTPAAGSNYPVIKAKPIVDAVEEYVRLKVDEKRVEARLKELKDQVIIPALDGAPTAFVGNRIVSVTENAGSPGTANQTITREMIGQVIPGKKPRASYTQLKVE